MYIDADNDGTADIVVQQAYDAWGNGTWWASDEDGDGVVDIEITSTLVCSAADPVRVPEAIDPFTFLAF